MKHGGRECKLDHCKRFGCLAYTKVQSQDRGKLDPKYERGVFLGCADNSTYQIGLWRPDLRCKNNRRWEVIESAVCKFDEDCLISNIEHLGALKIGTFTPFKSPNDLCDSVCPSGPGVAPTEIGPLAGVAPRQVGLQDSLVVGDATMNVEPKPLSEPSVGVDDVPGDDPMELDLPETAVLPPGSPTVAETGTDGGSSSNDSPAAPVPMEVDDSTVDELQTKVESDVDRSSTISHSDAPEVKKPDLKELLGDGVEARPGGVRIKKRRGRKKGTKAQPHWRKPGPKSKSKVDWLEAATNATLTVEPNVTKVIDDGDFQCLFDKSLLDHDEEVLNFTIQVSAKEAFEGEDAIKWFEADELERVQLEHLKCWRPLEDGEDISEVIPAVVIYSKKRCGRYKARLVALGNKQKTASNAEIYSPTISHSANRFLLVESAAKGYYKFQFDISNAFIKSTLGEDEKIHVRLPKHWSKNPKGDIVRLLKCLYGLKISPRAWYDTYKTYLESIGWEVCVREPGMFRKTDKDGNEMLLSIYVDDSFIAGANEANIKYEMDTILEKFPGKVIPPEIEPDGTHVMDIIGMTVRYHRESKTMTMCMDKAIQKLLKKFNMENCRSVATPVMPSMEATEGKENLTFPLRAMVGGLLYVAVMARPDISYAVQRVARCVCSPTENAIKCGKRILAYLKGTMSQGIHYSPVNERNFRSVYTKICREAGKELPDTVAFGDADFAGCSVTLRSTSGSILYHRGTPICWSAKRQTIRATSTCEAEYCALYDTIKLSLSQGFLDWYGMTGEKIPLTFCDNKSALSVSKSTITTKRSKHMSLRLHMVRDHCRDLCYVPTGENKADPLTKGLVGEKYLSMFKHAPERVRTDEEDCVIQYSRAYFYDL
jgi:hypothetical protein